MNAKDYALAYARRGWAVFPLRPGSKVPPEGLLWKNASTCDEAQIEKWCALYPGCNFGVDCEKSGLAIFDVDTGKHPEAADELDRVDLEYGVPPTYTVATPSGGLHLYYQGSTTNSSNALGIGLDTRGQGGYVVIPGGQVGGRSYRATLEAEVAPAPGWLTSSIWAGEKREPAEPVSDLDLDAVHNISEAVHYLIKQAPEAVEGSGGDATALSVAMRVRDFGVSRDVCMELIESFYSDKCFPYDHSWMAQKVRNAYKYASGQIGSSSIEAMFEDHGPAPDGPEPGTASSDFLEYDAEALHQLPELEWLVKGFIPMRSVTTTTGQSGAGKSFVALGMMAAIANGDRWFGNICRQTDVVYITLEGEFGVSGRIKAWELENQRKFPANVKILTQNPSRPVFQMNSPASISRLAAQIPKGSFVVIDTLNQAAPGMDENSSKDMGLILQGAKRLGTLIDGTVHLISHVGKDASKGPRGHSSFGAALDAAITVCRTKTGREIRLTKCKDGKDGITYTFDLEQVAIGMDSAGEVITSCVVRQTITATDVGGELSYTESIVLEAFERAYKKQGEPIRNKDWFAELQEICPDEATDTLKRRLSRSVAALVAKKYVRAKNGAYRPNEVDSSEEWNDE